MSDTPLGRDPAEPDRRLRREFAERLYGPQSRFAGVVGPDGRLEYANDAALALVGETGDAVTGELFWQTPWFDHDPEVQAAVRERLLTAIDGSAETFTTTHTDTDGETVVVDLEVHPMTAQQSGDRTADTGDGAPVVVTGSPVEEGAATAAIAALGQLQTLQGQSSGTDVAPLEERVRAVLELGSDYLGLSEGFYTKIDGSRQFIRRSVGDHPRLQSGEQAGLENTYCKETLAGDSPYVLEDVGTSVAEHEDAYETFGLECYVGSEVSLDGTTHGTLCFGDREPQPDPITAVDEAFVGVLASWLEHELEHERERDRLIGQTDRLEEFAGVVSHDLRSPLNAASGHLNLAAEALDGGDDTGDDNGAMTSVTAAQSALDRMTELVEEVRALAEQGRVVGTFEVVSLATVAEEAAATALPATATLTVDTEAGERVAADGERLRTVFENLFRNAVEHGGDDVSVAVTSVDPQSGDGEAGFTVTDDGPGFGDTAPDDVFEQGYTTRAEGMGYGLRIVEAIVQAHGWTVTASEDVDDSSGGGARFDVCGVEFEPEL